MKAIPIIAASVLSLPVSALAETHRQPALSQPDQAGFEGYVQVLAGSYDSEGLVNISKGNERIQSLDANSGNSTEDLFIPYWQVNYVFSGSRTSIFLGTSEDNAFQRGLNIEMGATHTFGNGTAVTAAYTPKVPELDNEVWQDPYQVGANRTRSKTSVEALRLSFKNILNTGISFDYGVGEGFVDDDHAGESQRSRLGAAQIKQLKRGGEFSQAYLSGIFAVSRHLYILPGISYQKVNANGEANRYEKVGGDIALAYEGERFEWYVDHFYGKADYDHLNPVFDQKREDKIYGISAGVSFLKPFGWKHVSFDLVGGETRQNSNIRFFDTRDRYIALGMTYRF